MMNLLMDADAAECARPLAAVDALTC